MEVVIVEFAVDAEQSEACVEALEALTKTLVAKQASFHGTTIYVDKTSGAVLNVMKWDQAEDFIEFRDSHQEIIGPAIGHFKPSPRFFAVARVLQEN